MALEGCYKFYTHAFQITRFLTPIVVTTQQGETIVHHKRTLTKVLQIIFGLHEVKLSVSARDSTTQNETSHFCKIFLVGLATLQIDVE